MGELTSSLHAVMRISTALDIGCTTAVAANMCTYITLFIVKLTSHV